MFTLSEKKSKEFTEEESHRSVIFFFLCSRRICSLRNWRVLSVEGFVWLRNWCVLAVEGFVH
jgi:hypothetical protein